MLRKFVGAPAIAAMMTAAPAMSQDPVRLYAAGSLKAVMEEIATAFKAETGVAVAGTFGPSGLLRNRIADGEAAEIFASANMAHPRSLAQEGRAGAVRAFALNRLCALATPQTEVTSATLLDRLLDARVRVATSTPKADPAGDYAWELFRKAEALRPGAYKVLDAKALKLVGGPKSPPPLRDRSVYGALVEKGEADVFLTYCTNAVVARKEVPALQIVTIPEPLDVGAEYGLTIVNGARPEAEAFAAYVRSPMGRAILVRHGFGLPPAPPRR